ncbi:MAG: DUF4266 domain-containing protein [Oceanococcaceae bacterium]
MALRTLLCVGLCGLLGACAIEPVQPWQRAHLAQPEMQMEPGLIEEAAIREHTYTSKEASSLGPALGGGGCGCN